MYKLFLEIVTSDSLISDIGIGFKPPYPKKSKIGVDVVIPDRNFKLITKLKINPKYKIPDFDYQPNYNPKKLSRYGYKVPVSKDYKKKSKLLDNLLQIED